MRTRRSGRCRMLSGELSSSRVSSVARSAALEPAVEPDPRAGAGKPARTGRWRRAAGESGRWRRSGRARRRNRPWPAALPSRRPCVACRAPGPRRAARDSAPRARARQVVGQEAREGVQLGDGQQAARAERAEDVGQDAVGVGHVVHGGGRPHQVGRADRPAMRRPGPPGRCGPRRPGPGRAPWRGRAPASGARGVHGDAPRPRRKRCRSRAIAPVPVPLPRSRIRRVGPAAAAWIQA